MTPVLAPTADQVTDLISRARESGTVALLDLNAAFERSMISERPGMLAATELAVFNLLDAKGLVSKGVLLRRLGSTR